METTWDKNVKYMNTILEYDFTTHLFGNVLPNNTVASDFYTEEHTEEWCFVHEALIAMGSD